MAAQARDPYQTLGVSAGASDQELRAAYRRLVQLHHPDHNRGSAESARRFEDVQEAYARIRELRESRSQAPPPPPPRPQARRRPGQPSERPRFDPDVEARAAELERELKKAQLARERARQAAREAARQAARDAARQAAAEGSASASENSGAARQAAAEGSASASENSGAGEPPRGRASDEELGYVHTDDSLSKILADARTEFSEHLSEAGGHPVVQRVSDLIDELAAKLTGERPPRP
jgi:curved DNA-binding protein CbpA